MYGDWPSTVMRPRSAGFGDGSGVRIWKIDQESLIASVRPHAKPVISIAFNPKYENQLLR